MKTFPTANQLSGRATGALFFTVFGSLWLLLSLYARQTLNLSTELGVLLGALALGWNAVHLMRRAQRFRSAPADPAQGRRFAWINAVQWIAVAAVAFSFARLHIDAYVLNAITAIVGLHMFPLARLFRYPLHHVTGAVLVVWSAASALMVPADQLQGVCTMGTGLILWLSAAVSLAVAFQAMRQPVRQWA
jgi:hypothetical protein